MRLVPAAAGSTQSAAEPLPPSGRVTLPGDWGATLGAAFRGRVRYLRRFGRPTNLAAGQSVCLVCDGVDLRGAVWVNGRSLGPIDGYQAATRFEIGADLIERNQLVIEVELPPLAHSAEQALRPGRAGLPGGLIGEVRLEIEPPG